MKKQFILLLLSFFVIGVYAQNNGKNDSTSFPVDPLAPQHPSVIIRDYAFIINEDSTYLFRILRPIRSIKNAYYISAHTTVMDSTIKVKIIVPKTNTTRGEKICSGKTYTMQLMRYYPYYLQHGLHHHYNYNFLFGKKPVTFQAVACSYIFTTDNLEGLRYVSDTNKKQNEYIPNITPESFIYMILQKDTMKIRQDIDVSSVLSIYKKFGKLFSDIKEKRLPRKYCRMLKWPTGTKVLKDHPFRVKRSWDYKKIVKSEEKDEDKLFYLLIRPFEDECQNFNIDSINIIESKLMYDKSPYYTYRVIWDSSLRPRVKFVTYLTVKIRDNHFKLVAMSSFSDYIP
ncbi:MAG: hypothetical protein J5725_02315 [Bacteroidales bacterium]|nr:hypothetical protein [Bacteroidales bacterium]